MGRPFGLFDKLRESFKEVNQEPWTSCEFDFTNKGKLKISFDYIDWKNSDFGPMARKIIINTKNSTFYQKRICEK